MHVLRPLRHVEYHIVRFVDAPDSPRLLRLPANRPQLLGHVCLIHVLADLARLDQLHDLLLKRLDFEVDLIVPVGRLAFDRSGLSADCFTVDYDRLRGDDLQTGLGDECICDLQMECSHARDEILPRLLVDARDEVRVLQ